MSRIRLKATESQRHALGDTPLPRNTERAIDVDGRVAAIDTGTMNRDRLRNVRSRLGEFGYGAALLSDPLNIRYATGTRNMQVWTMHAPGRYVFVPVDGPVVLFEFPSSLHLSEGFDTINEVRPSVSPFYFMAGPRRPEKSKTWADGVIELMLEHGGPDQRLAVDRCEPWNARHLVDAGISLHDAQEPLELARMIKTREEIQCLQLSVDVADVAVRRIRDALTAGMTENQLWSILHQTNIAHDGEWVECRLLASGPRTNPWFQESSNRVIEAGDLVAFDTDMVGPMGYLADISRTLLCPGRRASGDQTMLYELAQTQIRHNIALLEPGLTFAEFSARSWKMPDEYVANRYSMLVHGAGLVDESPVVAYPADHDEWGYDGVFEENMVVCVESYLGEERGAVGVKLEEQVLITWNGAVPMSADPCVDAFDVR